jgi:hypothetical protein
MKSHRRNIFLGLFFVLAAVVAPRAQSTQAPDTADASASFESLTTEDTASTAVKTSVSLLPDRMGPMESLMWSEKGLMRKTFDLPLTPESRAKELKARRNMLAIHQIMGFVTLAALEATVVLGQLTYNGNESLGPIHGAMAWTAVSMYFTTASLAIFTPPPSIRRKEWNSVSTHKLLATVHFSGMVLTPFLGRMVANNDRDLRTVHLVSGYVTTAAFAGAMIAVTF